MNISILGSCVTRDAMELDKNIIINNYFARTSLVSLASEILEIPVSKLKNTSKFRKMCVYNDVVNSLYSDYEIKENEYFIVDFIDERLDLVSVNSSIITYSNELLESELLNDYEYKRISRKMIDINVWKESADIFITEILDKYHPKRIILHKCYMSENYIKDGDIEQFENINEIKFMNKLFKEYYSYIEENIPGINVIDINESAIADANHKWGLSSCHFTRPYYEELIIKIRSIINAENNIFDNEQVYKGQKPIRYIFKHSKFSNNDKLLIIFSAFNSNKTATYNYIRALETYDCNKLFILDEYGDGGAYYIGCDKKQDIETSVISLITNVMSSNDIRFKDVIAIGSSKGGTAAFYYGTKYNFGTVISGAFQYKFGSYLAALKDKTIAESIMNEVTEENIMYYDSLIRKSLSKNISTEINLISGNGDWQYTPFMLPAIKYMKQKRIKYSLELIDIENHNEIAKHFPEFINSILVNKLESNYTEIYDKEQKTLSLIMNKKINHYTAFYLIKNGKREEVINYDMHEKVKFNLNGEGIYRIDIFIKRDNQRIAFKSKEITVGDV